MKESKISNLKKLMTTYLGLISLILIIGGFLLFFLASWLESINCPIWVPNAIYAIGGGLLGLGLIDLIFKSYTYHTIETNQLDNLILKTIGALGKETSQYYLKLLRVEVIINAEDKENIFALVSWNEEGQNLGDRNIGWRRRNFETYPEQNSLILKEAKCNGSECIALGSMEENHRKIFINDDCKANRWIWSYPIDLDKLQTAEISEVLEYNRVRKQDEYYIHIRNPNRRIELKLEIKGTFFNSIRKKVYDHWDLDESDLNIDPLYDSVLKDKEGNVIGRETIWEGSELKFDRYFGFEYEIALD